ncbi:restriction endonuclease subunit S [Methylovulum miyakonense]|uniref:restriction endonuclease subunit S n=1 Tax=Methylovulum miyakonense TaxID=645578 RepID=UPI000369434C|nr:restriction endonuclease subunit S [Methylovulum miyakonense]
MSLDKQKIVGRVSDCVTRQAEAESEANVGLRFANPTYIDEFSTLEEVSEVVDSLHKTPTYSNDGLPMVRATDVKYGNLNLTQTLKVDEKTFSEFSRRYKPSTNDIIITRVGSYGITSRVTKTNFCLGQNTSAIIPKNINPRYLYAVLNSAYIWSQIEAGVVGSTQKTLSLKVIKALKIPRLGDNIENEISTILGALDDRIALIRETNATLEAIAQALFKSWFVDFDPVQANAALLPSPCGRGAGGEGRQSKNPHPNPLPQGEGAVLPPEIAALFPDSFEESELGLIPKGWKVCRLGDVTEKITKGTTPTTLKRAFVPIGINFIKAESMTDDGGFISEKFAFIDNETHELLRRSQLEIGDVLISIAGTIGRVAIVTKDFVPANTNQAVALIRPKQDIFPSGLISRLLQRNESQHSIGEKVVQAVQANLSLGNLSDFKLVLPPPDVTKHLYQSGLAQIDNSKEMNHRRIQNLTSLRDTLLPRLISGQLRLPDAEAMLEETT